MPSSVGGVWLHSRPYYPGLHTDHFSHPTRAHLLRHLLRRHYQLMLCLLFGGQRRYSVFPSTRQIQLFIFAKR